MQETVLLLEKERRKENQSIDAIDGVLPNRVKMEIRMNISRIDGFQWNVPSHDKSDDVHVRRSRWMSGDIRNKRRGKRDYNSDPSNDVRQMNDVVELVEWKNLLMECSKH